MRNIVLIGMPSSGKSTVGVILAKTLGMGFIDTDLVIQQREGELLQTLIDNFGMERFLEIEEEAILSVKCESTVIATGGSAVFGERAMNHLKSNGTVVYLELDYPELERRLKNITTRGIAAKPGESLRGIYTERVPIYEKWAQITVNSVGKSVEETVSDIINKLEIV